MRPGIPTAPPAPTNDNSPGVVGRLAVFGNDVFTLGELQAKLAAADLKDCTARATLPLIAIVAAVVLVLGAIPVALLGVADLLSQALAMRIGLVRLLTALATFLAAAVVGLVYLRRFTSSFNSFRRSQDELTRNISWVRTVVLHSGRSAPNKKTATG